MMGIIKNMINILIIAVGIGICEMSILQIMFGTKFQKQVYRNDRYE